MKEEGITAAQRKGGSLEDGLDGLGDGMPDRSSALEFSSGISH